MVGIGRGARNGILVKEASALEQLAKVNLLAIDKTGTLTEGKPKVTEISCSQQLPESFIKTVKVLEERSAHPLAKAICGSWAEDNISSSGKEASNPEPDSFDYIPGLGIVGTVEGATCWIGNEALTSRQGAVISTEGKALAEKWSKEGAGIVFAGCDGMGTVIFKVTDTLRPGCGPGLWQRSGRWECAQCF